ncbi:MAG: hypothetical protein ACJ76F_05880 [Bacteroidia bacterium]
MKGGLKISLYIILFHCSTMVAHQRDSLKFYVEGGIICNQLRSTSFKPPLIPFYEPREGNFYFSKGGNKPFFFPSFGFSIEKRLKGKTFFFLKLISGRLKYEYNSHGTVKGSYSNIDFKTTEDFISVGLSLKKYIAGSRFSISGSINPMISQEKTSYIGITEKSNSGTYENIADSEKSILFYSPLAVSLGYFFKAGRRLIKMDLSLVYPRILFFKYNLKNNIYAFTIGISLNKSE